MIIDWKIVAQKIYDDIKNKVKVLTKKPKLVVILVWNNSASISYINQKRKYCEYVWFDFELIQLEEDIDENSLLWSIFGLNNDANVSWYIVQLPLPDHLNTNTIINAIKPEKDVDWFTSQNIGKLFLNDDSSLISCTPKWIKKLLDEYGISLKWKNVTIIGKSNIVWKPLALLFINNAATVTICDIYTKNISEHTLKSDIVVSATWVPWLIKKEMIKPWTIIIDVWFARVNNNIIGDCVFDELEKDNMITPVPGWVGPMTVAMLIENTYLAYLSNEQRIF